MGPCYSFVLTAGTRLLTLIRSFFIFFLLCVFVVLRRLPMAMLPGIYDINVSSPFILLSIFIGSVFIYSFCAMARKSRADYFSNWFSSFLFSSLSFSVQKLWFKRLLRLSAVVSFHHVVLCVLPINGYRVIKLHFRPISGQHIHKHT
jgi:hypothetical protein